MRCVTAATDYDPVGMPPAFIQAEIDLVRRVFLPLLLLLSSVALPVFAAETLTVYSTRHAPQDAVLLDRYGKAKGVLVDLIETDLPGLAARLTHDGKDSPADLLLVAGAANLHALQEAKLLQPAESKALGALPPMLRERDGNWFAISQCATVIAYRTDRVKSSEFSTYENLADPRWNGRLLVASSSSPSQLSILASLMAALGPDKAVAWARDYAANAVRLPRGSEADQLGALVAGDGDATLADSCQVARRWDASIGVFFPNQLDRGTHMDVSGMALAANAPHREAAIALMDYLLSPDAQQMFTAAGREYPVIAGVPVPPPLDSWGQFKAERLDMAVLGDNRDKAIAAAAQAGWQ